MDAEIEVDGPPPCVLVVADDHTAAEALCGLLRRNGYEALEASTPMAALRIAEVQRPIATLIDVDPAPMDGTVVAREMQAKPWCRGMLLLGFSEWRRGETAEVASAGFHEFFQNPVLDPVALLNLLSLFSDHF